MLIKLRVGQTVGLLLQANDCGRMLRDPAFAVAIAELSPAGVSADARTAARAALCDKYATAELTRADIERVFLSVADAQAYISATTLPVRRMLSFLERYFSPTEKPGNERFNLSLRWGSGGAKLDHDHKTQYLFVYQSLTLWLRIMEKMFTMWRCADDDLLNPRAYYHLSNTGQGMHRVRFHRLSLLWKGLLCFFILFFRSNRAPRFLAQCTPSSLVFTMR
jgi:hypothetical protein